MTHRIRIFLGLFAIGAIWAISGCRGGENDTDNNPNVSPEPWLMFHKDATHTGVASGVGNIGSDGPVIRWKYRITPDPSVGCENLTLEDCPSIVYYRWYSSFPLGDLDGDGTLEVVVTSADGFTDGPPRVVALKDDSTVADGVRELWSYSTASDGTNSGGNDQYSAALADADGDGSLDVLFSTKDGWIKAVRGRDGTLIWSYQTGRFIESGPVVGDLEGDGDQEVVIPTDCEIGAGCPGTSSSGAILVFDVTASGDNPPVFEQELEFKADSAEPALVDLDLDDGTDRLTIVFGSWGARFNVMVPGDGGYVVHSLSLGELDAAVTDLTNAVVRSTPVVYNFGQGPTAVFGWMPDWSNGNEARVSAVRLAADMDAGSVEMTPLWTQNRDVWKSSVALLPQRDGNMRVVAGYGSGNPGTGNYGECLESTLSTYPGGLVAFEADGEIAWEDVYANEGNIRASPAVGDIDGDGVMEAIITLGCFGDIRAHDGETGEMEWSLSLGPRTIGTPSLGDLDGDGTLEIVVGSYDGQVYVLGGP